MFLFHRVVIILTIINLPKEHQSLLSGAGGRGILEFALIEFNVRGLAKSAMRVEKGDFVVIGMGVVLEKISREQFEKLCSLANCH